jgi:hypothetical protein
MFAPPQHTMLVAGPRIAFLFVSSALFVAEACTSAPAVLPMSAVDPEILAVASAGLAVVEAGREPVVVVAEQPSAEAQAISTVRRVVPPTSVPHAEGQALPAGYFRLEEIRISGGNALFVGRLGPVPEGGPGVLACGTGFSIPMRRQADGTWKTGSYTIHVC